MSDLITVALPYIGGRYTISVPSGVNPQMDFKLWGAGGGAGGADRLGGGNGAGGSFVEGTTTVGAGTTVEVYVGEGGGGGGSSSGGGQGVSGASLNTYPGGGGGAAGGSGWSGGGGGGGGATLIQIGGAPRAVAGGGGGGGGGGNHGYGQSASGLTTSPNAYGTNTYPDGGSIGSWSNVLNVNSIWAGNGTYYWKFYFPVTGTYTFAGSIDNYGTLSVDNSPVLSIGGYSSVYTGSVYVTSGWHTISIYAINTGGPGALGATMAHPNGTVIWTTRSNTRPYSQGYYGESKIGDGGGGGGGGGGYVGGYGGQALIDNGDVGGYAGSNGTNYLQYMSGSVVGETGNGRIPGGVGKSGYPGDVGYGGIANYGAGQNGYAILTFYKRSGLTLKRNGEYIPITPSVKIGGVYSKKAIPWVKINGNWTPVLSDSTITNSNDSVGWGQ